MTWEPDEQQRRHLTDDLVAWLTTVTPRGRPAPRPVWFVLDGGTIVVFSEPDTAKVRHLAANPNATLSFNIGAGGGDAVVLGGTARVVAGAGSTGTPGYLERYESILPKIGHDRDSFERTYSTRIELVPDRAWAIP